MLGTNPFAELSAYIAPGVIQAYVALMIFLVVAGTLVDVILKKSAKYFFDNWRQSHNKGSKQIGGVEVAGLAVQTLASEVLTSSEFCNARRRNAHLLTMYGFVIYVVTTAIMAFGYTTDAGTTPLALPILWDISAFMASVGCYWFWFWIRVDVAAEGNSPLRVERADLFVLSMAASTTFALLWSLLQPWAIGWLFFSLYVVATTLLFGSIPWSKFAHMFFKPAAALQKRVAEADGTRSNLPPPADKPEVLGTAIRTPRNY